MHVGRGPCYVPQRGHLEQPHVLRLARDAADAFIDVGKLQPVVKNISGRESVRRMAHGTGGHAYLPEENLPPQIFLRREVRKTNRDALVITRVVEMIERTNCASAAEIPLVVTCGDPKALANRFV